MRILPLTVVMLLMVCGFAQANTPPAPVDFNFVAVKAENLPGKTTKVFGKGLESVRRDIANLSYNSFQKLSAYSGTIPFGSKTKVPLSDIYTLEVEPIAVDQQGRIKLKTQVLMKKKKKDGKTENIKALDTVLAMAPGKKLNLGGLKLKEGGDLVIVLSVK